MLEPQKVIEDADRIWEKYRAKDKAWRKYKKNAKNIIPYIEAIPYSDDFLVSKVVQRTGIDKDKASAFSRMFWYAVRENMKDPQFKMVEFGTVGHLSMRMSKIKFFAEVPLMLLAKRVRDACVSRGQVFKNTWAFTRLIKVNKIYRYLRDSKNLDIYNTYVRKINQSQKD